MNGNTKLASNNQIYSTVYSKDNKTKTMKKKNFPFSYDSQ